VKVVLLLDIAHRGTEAPPAQQLAEHRELAAAADELGFDAIVHGQHFLGSELRYYQPIPYLADLAHSAQNLRIVLGIMLLSFLHPVQVAEDVATLDVLTGGRVTFGAGLGYSDREFHAFGVERRTRARRFEEALSLVKALWSGEPVHHEGTHFEVEDGVRPSVLPLQEPRPPIWIAGQAEPAVRRAARLGDAWYAPPFPTHDALRELREIFLEERERSGLPASVEFPVRRELLVAPTKEEARRGAELRSRARYQTYLDWGLGQGGGLRDAGGSFGEADEAETEGRFLLGPPEDCAAGLARLRDEVGMTHFVFKPQWPGLPHVEAMRQLEQLGTEVMPLVG
jgi:alkanesulfonate monooxygenase SsuD/methylene tetrahydromethanopterin reductase-like flavin-dependent oxidoreductase (luciferase family)